MVLATAPTLCAAKSGTLFDTGVFADPCDPAWGWRAVGEAKPTGPTIDSMADPRDYAGWWIDTKAAGMPGQWLDIVVVVDLKKESHGSPNRAGLTLAFTTEGGKSVVVNIWESEAWLADESPLSKRGESVRLRSSGRHEIKIEEAGEMAVVSVDSQRIGRVPLRDFSSVAGVPHGYLEPGTVFVGDASTMAGSQASLVLVKWNTRGVDVDVAKAILSTTLAVLAGGSLVAAYIRRKPRERHTGRVFIDRR